MKPRITAAAGAIVFAVTTALLIFALLYDDSVGQTLEGLRSKGWNDVFKVFITPIAMFLVGYLAWGLFLRKPVTTRRRALVIGTFAGVTTTIATPLLMCLGELLVTLFRRMTGESDEPLTMQRSLSDVAFFLCVSFWPTLFLLFPLALAGWLAGWFVPLERASGGSNAPTVVAPSRRTPDRPLVPGLRTGDDPTHIAMQPAP